MQSSQEIEKKLADRMAKSEDNDQPEAYFQCFEETIKEAEISTGEWPDRSSLARHWQPILRLFLRVSDQTTI